nr:MAG: hypothetical protein DIU78_03400 [Pseudomonadota bacterium]
MVGQPGVGPCPAPSHSRRLSALLVLAVILVLLLGGNRLAAPGKGLGAGLRTYRKAVRGEDAPPKAKPVQVISVSESPPKLLPAKGETGKPPQDDRGS